MKKTLFSMAAVVLALGASAGTANAQDVLTGDTRLACEAILCLSSGTRPGECSPALSRYFDIRKRKFSDTIKARLNFLNRCPVASQTPDMAALVSAISRGAGRCDAASLNATLRLWWGDWEDGHVYISNRLPDYCGAYTGHAYTDFKSSGTLPRYVGQSQRGGYWVDSRDYNRALAEYERIRRENEQRRRASLWGN